MSSSLLVLYYAQSNKHTVCALLVWERSTLSQLSKELSTLIAYAPLPEGTLARVSCGLDPLLPRQGGGCGHGDKNGSG